MMIMNFSDELDSLESVKVTEILEEIDGEINNIDITFVKMADPRYARKWGVTKLPSIVFFRKRFPSIYRGGMNFMVNGYFSILLPTIINS